MEHNRGRSLGQTRPELGRRRRLPSESGFPLRRRLHDSLNTARRRRVTGDRRDASPEPYEVVRGSEEDARQTKELFWTAALVSLSYYSGSFGGPVGSILASLIPPKAAYLTNASNSIRGITSSVDSSHVASSIVAPLVAAYGRPHPRNAPPQHGPLAPSIPPRLR